MIILIIKLLELISFFLEKTGLFSSIKEWVDSSLHHCHKKHRKTKMKNKNNKSNKNKLITVLLIINMIFSGYIFYKWYQDDKLLNALIVEYVAHNPEIFNNKDYQNNFHNNNNDPNNENGFNQPSDDGTHEFDPFNKESQNPTRSL